MTPAEQITLLVFVSISIAYLLLFVLGRRWRTRFEADGVTYWRGPKKERLKELLADVWDPKRFAVIHGTTYFTEGYVRTSVGLWVPFFLLEVQNISATEVALFVALTYIVWSWKGIIGLIADAFTIQIHGHRYRRLPWFLLAGVLSTLALIIFLFNDPTDMAVWTALLPTVTLLYSADAIHDLAADAYAIDVTPPDHHGRMLGGVAGIGRALGGALACVVPPLLISVGGYRLNFIVASIVGMSAFFCGVLLKEPKIEYERAFSKRAVAFTFTEKSVFLVAIVTIIASVGPQTFSDPQSGMFTVMAQWIGVPVDLIPVIALVTQLEGVLGSYLSGWVSDKYGHKRTYMYLFVVRVVNGFLWATLRPGMVVWFILLMIIPRLIPEGGLIGLQGDVTPLGMTAVYQMFKALTHIGRVVTATVIGIFLPLGMPICIVALTMFRFVPPIVVRFVQPVEAGKATEI